MTKLSESERAIMRQIWAMERPVTSAQLVAAFSESRGWKAQTVNTFLTRLCEKGMLVGRRRGAQNLYDTAMEEADYRAQETKAFLKEVHRGSVQSFLAALCNEDGLTKQEIDELKDWLAQR